MLLGEKYNLKLRKYFSESIRYESSIIVKNDKIINSLCDVTDRYYKYLLDNNQIHINLLFNTNMYYELNINSDEDLYNIGVRSVIIYIFMDSFEVIDGNSLYDNFYGQFYGEDIAKYRIDMIKGTTKFQNNDGLLIASLCGFKVDFISYDMDINYLYLLKTKNIDYHFDFSILNCDFFIKKTDFSYNELYMKGLHNIIYCKYSISIHNSIRINTLLTKEDVYNICCDYIVDKYNIFKTGTKLLFSIDCDNFTSKWLYSKFYTFFNTEEIKSIISITHMSSIQLVSTKYVLKIVLRMIKV